MVVLCVVVDRAILWSAKCNHIMFISDNKLTIEYTNLNYIKTEIRCKNKKNRRKNK